MRKKTGTFTSSEHRIQMVRQAVAPSGNSRPDWQIIADLAQHLLQIGGKLIRETSYSKWEYANTSQVMEEIASLTPGYGGISYKELDSKGWLFRKEQASLSHEQHSGEKNKFVPVTLLSG